MLGYGLTAVIAGVGMYWAYQNWDSLSRAFALSPSYLILLIPLILLSNTWTGLLNQVMATHLGAPLPLCEVIPLGLASSAANYFLPMRAGAGLRAGYFKKRCNLPLTAFASSMAAVYVMTLLANALMGLLAMTVSWCREGIWSWAVFFVLFAVAGGCLIAIVFSPKPREGTYGSKLLNYLIRIHHGWDMLRRSPSVLAKSAGLSVLLTLTLMIRLFVVYSALGRPVSMDGCLLVAAMTAVSTFVSITPAGLGIREAMILFSSVAIGVSAEVSLLAAAADRAVAVGVLVLAGPASMLYLSRKSGQSLSATEKQILSD